jgi:hypothetical protein
VASQSTPYANPLGASFFSRFKVFMAVGRMSAAVGNRWLLNT